MNRNLLASSLAVGKRHILQQFRLLNACYPSLFAFFVVCWLLPSQLSAQCDQLMVSSAVTICQGELTQLRATGGDNYNWSPTLGLSCTNCADPIASPTSSTTYTVSCNDNGILTERQVTVTVMPMPSITNITSNPSSGCDINDGDIVIQANGGTGDLEYSIDNGFSYQDSPNFFNLIGGIYQIKVRNSDDSCEVDGGEVDLGSADSPSGTISFTMQPEDCSTLTGAIAVSASGGTGVYNYSIDNGVTWQGANSFTNIAAGFYRVKIRNSNTTCETNVGTVILADPERPFIGEVITTTPTCGNSDGEIMITATGTATLEYSINGSDWQSSNEFSNLSGDNYTVMVRNQSSVGCVTPWDNNPVVLNAGTPPTITSTTFTNPTDCGVDDGTVTVEASGEDVIEYSLDGGTTYQSENIFMGVAAGTYTAMVRNGNGTCAVASDPVTLTAPIAPNLGVPTNTNPTDCDNTDGTITLTATNGNDPGNYEFSIDGGITWESSGSFSTLRAGQYFPAVRNASMNCQVDGATINLVAPSGITINNIMTTTPSDCGASDGAISINVSGGTGTFRYRLNDGNFVDTPNFTGLALGNYLVTIRNSDGTCETNGNIIQLDGLSDIAITDVQFTSPTNCEIPNGEIVIEATGSEQMEYSINGTNFQLSNVFGALTEGDYTPMVRYSAGQKCPQMSGGITLEPAPRAVITGISSSDITDCNGTTNITFGLSATSTGDYEYSINGGQDWQDSEFFGGVSAGMYNFRVRNQDGSCLVDGGSRTFEEPTPPVVNNISATDPTDCGLTDGEIVITATGALGQPALEYTNNGGIDWQDSNEFEGLSGGNYLVSVRYNNGTCGLNTVTTTLTTPTPPTISDIQTTSPSVCGAQDGTITITATNGSGTYSYSIDGGMTFQNSAVFNTVFGGDYTIAVRNRDESCVVISNITTTVEESNPPTVNQITANDPTGCGLSDGQFIFDVTGAEGLTLEYSINGGVDYQLSNTFNDLPESTYNLFVRYTNGGCAEDLGNFIIDNPDAPEIQVIDARNPECDAANGTITINARHDGSAALEYSINGGTTYQASNFFENLDEGTYPLRVRVVGGNCTMSAGTSILEENPPPVINFVNVIQSDNCSNINGIIEIFTSGGNPEFYEYSINGGNNWQTSRRFENLASGVYDVAVRVLNTTCVVAHDETAILDQPIEPVLGEVTTISPSCGTSNGSISISASSGNAPYQYTINGGQNWQPTATFSNLPEGNYLVGVRNNDGNCAVFGQNFRLSEPDDPEITMINSDNPTCDGNDGMIEIIATGAVDLEYSIDGGDTYVASNQFTGLDVNTYEVFVRYTDDETCSVNAGTVQLVDPDRPTMTGVNVNNPSNCGAADGTIQITANGTSALEYSIDDGLSYQPSNNFQNLVAGNYPIRVRFTDGSCEIFGGNVAISDPASPTITMIDNSDPSDCNVNNGSITVTATSGSELGIEYSINGGETFQSSNVFNGLGGGTYVIQARNDDGSCVVAGSTITLTDKVEPEIIDVSTKDPDCESMDGEIVINATGGGPIQYSIDGGATYQNTGEYTNLGEGIYNIRIRNLDESCVISSPSVTLSEPASASVTSFDATNPSCNGDDGSIEIFITGGDGNIQYSIDNGTTYQDENLFENLTAQEYNIFIRNSDGRCSQFGGTTELIAPDIPNINGVTVSDVTNCATNDASITVNTNEANVEFSNNGGQSYQTSNVFSNLGSGTYDIRARRVGQTCEVLVEVITIAVPDQPMATVTSTNPTSCDTDNGSISISSDNANQEYSLDNITFQSGRTFENLGGGTYTVYARFSDNTSCTAIVAEDVVLTAPVQPIINSVTAQNGDCQGNGGTITISATGNDIEYSIDNGVTFQSANGFVNVAAGNYQVVVRNVDGSCPVNGDAVTIEQQGSIVIDEVSVESGDCSTASTASITITASDTDLEYSINGGTSYQSSNVFENLAAGNYQIRVRKSDGSCTGAADDVTIASGTPPMIASIDATNPDCGQTGGRIAITTQGTGDYEFSINDGATFQTANIFNSVAPGTYQIRVRNANGSCEVSADNTVTINSASEPTINNIEQTNPTACGTNDGTIAIDASGAGDIEYSLDAITFQTGNLFSGLAPGTYQVTIRNADGTCQVTANNAIILLGAEAPEIIGVDPNDPTGCGAVDGSIEITANGSNLEYSIDGGDSYQSGNLFENLNSGTYQIRVRRTDADCEAIGNDVVLSTGEEPVFTTVNVTDSGACGVASGSIIINVDNNTNVEYSIDNGATYQTNNRFEDLEPGSYNLRIRSTNGGCETEYVSNPVVISGEDNIVVSDVEVSNPSDCGTTDGAITISVSGANEPVEYSINGGANYQDGATFINLSGGIYNVLVRTVNSGCMASANGPVELVAPTAPMITAVDFNHPTGCEESNGTISITAEGDNLMYSVDNGVSFQGSPNFDGLGNGMYQIVVQNNDGSCTTPFAETITLEGCCDIQYTIEQLSNGRYQVSLIPDTTFVGNDNGTLAARITLVAPAGGFEIENFENSSPNVAFQINSVLAPAGNPNSNYYVFDLGTATMAISYQEGVSVPLFTFGNASGCAADGEELTLYDEINDLYQGNDVGQSIDIMGFGDTEITICVTGNTSSVPIPSILESVNVTPPVNCVGNGAISIVTTNGIPVEYSINGGADYQSSPTFEDLIPGSYLVAVRRTDENCEIFYSDNPVMINGNMPAIINSVSATDPTVCGLADGTITITASGEGNFEYSIDGGAIYQSSNEFINLSGGTYNIMVRHTDGSCPVTYDQNPVTLTEPSAEVSITDVTVEDADCDGTNGSIIIDAQGCDALEYSVDGTNFQPNNAFLNLNAGTYAVTVRSTVDNNMTDMRSITLERETMCTDTIRVTLPPVGGEVCIDDVLNLPNSAGANTLCEQAENTPVTLTDNNTCFDISPIAEFIGMDTLCIVTCDNITTTICDTTYVIVTIDPMASNIETDTVRITLPPSGGEVCIDEVLDVPNGAGANTLCEQAENTPISIMDNETCFDINPVADFIGVDTVCLVTCDASQMDVCDTTFIIITIDLMVVDIQTDTIRMDIDADESVQICINEVLDLPNGAGSSDLCNTDHIVAPNVVNTDGNVCVNITTPTDFMSSDTICIVTCDVTEMDLCDTTIVIISPTMTMEVPLPDTIHLMTPVETGIDLCYDEFILPADDVDVTLCGEPSNGSVSISEDEPCISYFPDLGYIGSDEYCISFCDANDATNCDTLYVLIDVMPRTDIITIEVDNTEPFDTCVTDVLDLLGDYASSAICDMNADEVMVTLDQECVTIDPVEGFNGTTEICVVVCDDNNPQVCDTTQIVVTVVSPTCTEDIFFMDVMTLPNVNGGGELCVPIPFNESSTYDVSVDGVDYSQAFGRCDIDSMVVYFYGNIASADTLQIASWTVNDVVYSDTVSNGIMGLMNFLNINDPSETWEVDTITNTLSTTNLAENTYGDLILTPNTTGQEITLNPGSFGTANGFSINIIGAGEHQIVVTNTMTGCIDELTVIIEEEEQEPCDILTDGPINLTTEDCMELFTVCLNDSLPNFNDYTLEINGVLYDGDFQTCTADTMFRYLYTTVPDLASVGPYTIDSWVVNGEVLTGTFNNIAGLIAFMNGVDAGGNWMANFQTFSIIGGNNANTYGDLMITQDATEAGATLSPTTLAMPSGVAIELGVGNYFLELSNADGCLDELAINITCPDSPEYMDTDITVDVAMDETETICITDIVGINNGDIASVTNTCPDQSGTNAIVTIDEDTYCIDITGVMEGMDIACIEVCDITGDCVTITITINTNDNTDCMDIINQEIIGMGIDCSDSPIEGDLCLDIPLMMFSDIDVEVNGVAYTGTLQGCKIDSSFTYSYFTLISLGDGPYRVESWMVNGVTLSGAFETVEALVDSMNVWDETAMWMQDESTLNIVGGNPTTTYGSLQISDTVTGASATIELNRSLVPIGTVLTLPLGTNEVVFIDQETGCRDTVSATIACMMTDTIPVTVIAGEIDTLCVDTLELMGNFVNIENACPEESGEFSLVNIDEETLCVTFEGIEAGEERACIIVCDDLNICDTTYFDITIIDEDSGLEAIDDRDTTTQGGAVVINVLNNDEIPSNALDTFYVDTPPLNGTAMFNVDGTITYQHDGNGCDITDAFTYVICTAVQCDTAVVEVYISCEGEGGPFTIFNGFSPNEDGVNDTFVIQGIDQFPDNTLRIYNRWGNLVLEQQDYKNNWSGTWMDKDLPDGTYFYVFDTGTGEIMSGWLQIAR